MHEQKDSKPAVKAFFGIARHHRRGFGAIVLILLVIYLAFFENIPSPSISATDVTSSRPPEIDFKSRAIELPDPAVETAKDPPTEDPVDDIIQTAAVATAVVPALEPATAPDKADAKASAADQAASAKPVVSPPPIEANPSPDETLSSRSPDSGDHDPANDKAATKPTQVIVQVAALSSQSNAQELAAKLVLMLKVDTAVNSTILEGKTLYRIQLGPFASRAVAITVSQRLDKLEQIKADYALDKVLLINVP